MDELLKALATADGDGDDNIGIDAVSWADNWLELSLKVLLADVVSLWQVRCESVFAYRMTSSGGWLDFTDAHPLVWEFKRPSADAFISGKPDHVAGCVGTLYEAHQKATGGWIPFAKYINACPTILELVRHGNGLFARAVPLPLLNVYKRALEQHGLEVAITPEKAPGVYLGGRYRTTAEDDVKALVIGESYFVGVGWTARKTS